MLADVSIFLASYDEERLNRWLASSVDTGCSTRVLVVHRGGTAPSTIGERSVRSLNGCLQHVETWAQDAPQPHERDLVIGGWRSAWSTAMNETHSLLDSEFVLCTTDELAPRAGGWLRTLVEETEYNAKGLTVLGSNITPLGCIARLADWLTASRIAGDAEPVPRCYANGDGPVVAELNAYRELGQRFYRAAMRVHDMTKFKAIEFAYPYTHLRDGMVHERLD